MHHRKEGWPSDSRNIAKHPLIARPGWFSDKNNKENHPGCVCFGGFAIFFDDTATPPCGNARRGLSPDSDLFTASKARDYKSRALARVQFLIFPPEIQERLCRFQNLSVVHLPHKDRVIAGKVLCDDLTLHDRD